MSNFKDITGQRFGRLTVVERVGSDKDGRATWKCQCDCGNEAVVMCVRLRRGSTRSCGCLVREKGRRGPIKHGKTETRLYGVWCSMKHRCYYTAGKYYHRYGGRGITVCDEWRNSFQAFYEWAMANGYDENAPKGQCTIDRIDNDKGYCPDNCRWVDVKTQNSNRSNSKKENCNEGN